MMMLILEPAGSWMNNRFLSGSEKQEKKQKQINNMAEAIELKSKSTTVMT